MKKYFKPILLIYIAIALGVSGYLYLNPPLSTTAYGSSYEAYDAANDPPKGHRFKDINSWSGEFGGEYYNLITYNENYSKYSLLFFSVGGLILYAIVLFKKAKD